MDLILQAEIKDEEFCKLFIERCFDRIELGFVTEWTSLSEEGKIEELQSKNRFMTNEKNKYLTIFESIKNPVFLLDDKNKLVNLNHAAKEMFMELSRPGSDYYGEKNLERDFPWLGKMLREFSSGKEKEKEFEKELSSFKGPRYVQIKVKKMLDISDKFTGTVIIFNDITERKMMERELRNNEERLKIILENLQTGVVIIEADTHKIVEVNSLAAQIIGAPKEYIRGKVCHDFICPLEKGKCPITDLKQEIDRAERILVKADGEEIPILKTVVPLTINNRLYLIDSFIDISEQKKMEEALRKSEEWFRTVFDAVKDAMITIDENGRITLFNPAAEEMFGWNNEEISGKPVELIMPEKYREKHGESVRSYFSTGKPDGAIGKTLELRGRRKDGSLFPLELSLSAGQNRNEKFALGVIRDITLRKRAEEELIRKNAELDEFTYIASHDLQEPLRKIVAFSDFLCKDAGEDLPERASKDLGFIVDAARRMQTLIQDLLDLSHVGKKAMKKKKVSLDLCVKRALENLSIRIKESNTEISMDNLPELFVDSGLFTQVYQNLIENAIKFSGEEKPKIRLTAEKIDGRWILGVKDNGIGINPEYGEKIFMPFKRLHGRSKYKGSGIGLSIVRKVIELHEGKIWVESEAGKGAHFKFMLN